MKVNFKISKGSTHNDDKTSFLNENFYFHSSKLNL